MGDADRSRAIYELAINQPRLDMPEVLWKAYIDFEIEQEEYDNTRNLYRRLLERTKHVKVRYFDCHGIKQDLCVDLDQANPFHNCQYFLNLFIVSQAM